MGPVRAGPGTRPFPAAAMASGPWRRSAAAEWSGVGAVAPSGRLRWRSCRSRPLPRRL